MAEEMMPKKTAVKDVLSRESKKTAAPKSDSKTSTKKKHKHTHIEHHDDGSHTVRHTPEGGGPEVSYAAPDLDAVHDGMEEHVGDPNAAQAAPDAAPDAAAQPAQVAAQPAAQPTPGA